jgi:hypothetical protein
MDPMEVFIEEQEEVPALKPKKQKKPRLSRSTSPFGREYFGLYELVYHMFTLIVFTSLL